MKSTLIVSGRGQITLPSVLRKKMGIKDGGVVTVEEKDGKLLITPAALMEVEMYTDDQIKEWLEEDRLEPGEEEEITRKLSKIK
jgi:antitoxin PrlF